MKRRIHLMLIILALAFSVWGCGKSDEEVRAEAEAKVAEMMDRWEEEWEAERKAKPIEQRISEDIEVYLEIDGFSRDFLIDQLKREEDYTEKDIIKVIDSSDIDWFEQAAKWAEKHKSDDISVDLMITMLEDVYDFTHEQAEYGANKAYGMKVTSEDTSVLAVIEKANSLLKRTYYSKSKLTEELVRLGYDSNSIIEAIEKCDADWEEEALELAHKRLDSSYYSYESLYEQLKYQEFTEKEIEYALKKCGADWKKEALELAHKRLDDSAYSYSRLYDQLIYGGFTEEESLYALENCGANWKAEALEKAKKYHESYSEWDDARMKQQLLHEGFEESEADYAIANYK